MESSSVVLSPAIMERTVRRLMGRGLNSINFDLGQVT